MPSVSDAARKRSRVFCPCRPPPRPDGKAPLFTQNERGQKEVATGHHPRKKKAGRAAANLERTGMGIGMGKEGSQPGLNGRVGGREGKKTRERFLAASLTEGSCRARTCNLRGKGLAFHPLDHRVGEVYAISHCLVI